MFVLPPRSLNITGVVYGSLTVLNPVRQNTAGEVVWDCVCTCGTHVAKSGAALRTMSKKYLDPRLPSCGCMRKVLMSAAAKTRFITHGFAKASSTHPLYKLYHKVLSRCHNPSDTNYHHYGAKGITVCQEWRGDPKAFVEWCLVNGWQEGLQLDKDILCDQLQIAPKIYGPLTCQFVTQQTNLTQSASRSTYGSNKNIKFSSADVAEMNAMYLIGATKAEVARQFSISKTHCRRLITSTR